MGFKNIKIENTEISVEYQEEKAEFDNDGYCSYPGTISIDKIEISGVDLTDLLLSKCPELVREIEEML